jgi:ubiquinone/menaquinone biosynthesis C-methylase UbiE
MAPPALTTDNVHDEEILKAQKQTVQIQSNKDENKNKKELVHMDSEREVWEFMTPMAWHKSIASPDSIFGETYEATRSLVQETAKRCGYDVIVEVGCGTGDVIGELTTDIPRIGLDINEEFIQHCLDNHKSEGCEFHVADALHLVQWWKEQGLDQKFSRPLVTCVNNTLNIMPEHLRGGVVAQMLALAGEKGMCMASYWNGNFFSHAVMNYYRKNEALCGKFDLHDGGHVDWEHRCLLTPTNYSTEWHIPEEVRLLFRAMDVDVPNKTKKPLWGHPHMFTAGLAIFVWFDLTSTSHAKDYYDSDDAQKFYNNIWGEDTLHVGRYDLIPQSENDSLSAIERVAKAQELHELEFVKVIKERMQSPSEETTNVPLRVVDMGCGYGGMLRRLWKEGMVWRAVGADISARMCAQAKRLNAKCGAGNNIEILEQSYLDMSVPAESADLVISMDALLHVGPERQRSAIAEAARILRPGGWLIFSDIMQEEEVDAEAMAPIYKRIHLSKMGTVSNYKSALEECGLHNIHTDLFSDNISKHYGSVLEVLQEKGSDFGISPEFQAKMEEGLTVWKTKSPGNIVWGFVAAQKTEKVRKFK